MTAGNDIAGRRTDGAPAPGSSGKRPFSVAPEADLLYSLAADGSRKHMDPTLVRGRYWRIRLGLAVGLAGFFVAAPHLFIEGKPLLLLDLARRQFTFVGATFHPTDNLVLLALGATVIITLFAVTSLFGRLWCGYACPHPIYLEFLYRPLETLVEGKPAARRRRDRGPWTLDRAWRKAAKWSLYGAVSLVLSLTFVAYFVGWEPLLSGLVTAPLQHRGALLAALFTAGAMMFNFGSFRDQMCIVACPYGRLQTVLYDQDTIIIGYDGARGEPRGARKKGAPAEGLGDCTDCLTCNRVCPTGMDIRRGLQMECIGCAQCAEGCDEVQARQGRPPGLIRYTSLRELAGGGRRSFRPRVALYGLLLTLALGSLVYLTLGRAAAEAEILRNGREPYRLLGQGQVANMLRLRLTNRLHRDQRFTVELAQPATGRLVVSRSPFSVGADAVETLALVALLPEAAFVRGQVRGVFVIESDAGVRIEHPFVLLGPYNGAPGGAWR